MQNNKIVIVDDENEIIKSYEIFLRRLGYRDCEFYNAPELFLNDIDTINPAVLLLDLCMPGISGEKLLTEVNERLANTSVIIVSGREEVDTAVRCIKNGALDYLVKPIDNNRLNTAITKGLEVYRLKSELQEIKCFITGKNLRRNPVFDKIITNNYKMLEIFDYVEAIARSDAPVLITGETGTGKELIAEAVHGLISSRKEMTIVNVSALDESMFNDTLFGHVKGAFTSAERPRDGLLAVSDNGTVFLDEIGDLNESSQIKLLRVLQDNTYFPVGSDKPLKTNCRIIAATNADLKQKVSEGSFRQDLYYRLKTHEINIPPLRERQEDIELLFCRFFTDQMERIGSDDIQIPFKIITLLKNHNFPGNIRELQSIVHDYSVIFGSTPPAKPELKQFLQKHGIDYQQNKCQPAGQYTYSGRFPTLKEIEADLIKTALNYSEGNQSKAASLLGISLQALNKRIKS